ncbi:MAG: MBL fold metallo-hydrolase [Firmicutes bacterium]|nr:MBL fold metallo-hydrolase [Bacillota bacterium]
MAGATASVESVQIGNMKQIACEMVEEGALALWWLGQAGYALKASSGHVLFIDPYLSDSVAGHGGPHRLYPPPLDPAGLSGDLLLTTHNHDDHLDPETVRAIQDPGRFTFVGPRNCCIHFARLGIPESSIVKVDAGEEVEVSGIRIKGTFTIPNDDNALDSEGFLITFPGGIVVYHSGDTAYHKFLTYLEKYEIDIVLPCINGKYGNMSASEAAELARAIGPKLVIPNHYDIFADNQADPEEFRKLVADVGPSTQCRVLRVMEKFVYRR